VAGAGTGTFALETESGVYNELQVGSYVFMDTEYARIGNKDGGLYTAFEHSLFVLASVISTPTADRAIVDAGLKSYSAEKGPPWVHGLEDVEVTGVSDEHGKLLLGRKPTPGARRESLADSRPLRSDRQPARLVCRRAARPRGGAVADRGARREYLTVRRAGRYSTITMLPAESSSACAPGGTTQVESYSSTMSGPLRPAAESARASTGVSSQPCSAEVGLRGGLRAPLGPARFHTLGTPPPSRRPEPTSWIATSSTGSSGPARWP
jgi:hypothetical protein